MEPVTSIGRSLANSNHKQTVILASISLGLVLFGVIANYFVNKNKSSKSSKSRTKKGGRIGAGSSGSGDGFNADGGAKESIAANGGIGSSDRHSVVSASVLDSPSHHSRIGGINIRGGLNYSDKTGHNTSSVLTNPTIISYSLPLIDQNNLTSTQLGLLGAEKMDQAIRCWEESLAKIRSNSEELAEEDQLNVDRTVQNFERILDSGYALQMLTEELFLHDNSVLYGDNDGRNYRLRSVSSIESFVSADDYLSDEEDIQQSLENVYYNDDGSGEVPEFPLYDAAIRLVDLGTVPYRTLKTEMVGCAHDREYLAKLHCLRGAFSKIMHHPEKRHWIITHGKQVLSDIILKADKDPREFDLSYDKFVRWSQEDSNWSLIDAELKDRGLRALTFYDIVIDFIFLDAFEDLESPPASVLAVTQNRWLSNSFKETALGTAVWSVIKTKRRWLRYSEGFVAHFYDLSEHIMPTLAWGFLGPPTRLQELCNFFKDKFLEFLKYIFSFDHVRYTNLDDLAFDIMFRMEEMHGIVSERLNRAEEYDEDEGGNDVDPNF